MRRFIFGFCALALSACAPLKESEERAAAKSAYREELFFRCLKELPAGPNQTRYNDWSEVVTECGQQAFYMMNTRFQ